MIPNNFFINSIFKIGQEFIVSLIKKYYSKYQVNDCVKHPDITLKKYFERTSKKCKSVSTLIPEIQKKLLSDIYLPLTLKSISFPIINDTIKLDKYNQEKLNKYNNILIIDNAGMGKSTLMKFLYLEVLKQLKHIGIPFFIELRLLPTDQSIIDYLFEEINDINDKYSKKIKKEFLQTIIEDGKCIFFFDGYDEISLDNKRNITKKLQSFINKANKNKYFISSRNDESLSSFNNDFYRFSIKSLSKTEAYSLLSKFDNNSITSKNLISNLEKDNNFKILHEFLSNPLMISLLYFNFKYTSTFPNNKYEFYEDIYINLYNSHDLRKGDDFKHDKYSNLNIIDFKKILYYIGFYSTFQFHKTIYTENELLSLITDAAKYYNITFVNINYLNDLSITIPLFIKIGSQYSWIHKSFQEYFTARFIYEDNNHIENTLKNITQSKNIAQYSNILDFYYDIDTKAFKQYIIKDLLEKFINYMENGNTIGVALEDNDYYAMKSALFSKKVIISYMYDKNNIHNLNTAKNNIKIALSSKYCPKGMYYYPNKYHIYLDSEDIYPYATLIKLLFNKKLNIFSKITSHYQKIPLFSPNKKIDIVYVNHIVNNIDSLKEILHSLDRYLDNLFYSLYDIPLLDYNKCKALLIEINNEISTNKNIKKISF